MDSGNVGPGQMMEQWNNFEAPNYNPEYKNVDPALDGAENSFERNIEQKNEQLFKNMNLEKQNRSLGGENIDLGSELTKDAYGNVATLGGAELNGAIFQTQEKKNVTSEMNSAREMRAPQERNAIYEKDAAQEMQTAPLGEVVTTDTFSVNKKNEVLGTDLPKAKDIDGLEPELIKAVDSVINIKDPVSKYKKMRGLKAKLLLDRYGRILGQGNG